MNSQQRTLHVVLTNDPTADYEWGRVHASSPLDESLDLGSIVSQMEPASGKHLLEVTISVKVLEQKLEPTLEPTLDTPESSPQPPAAKMKPTKQVLKQRPLPLASNGNGKLAG
ncbi:hypothetical protein ACN4EK_10565 [Pantanalinema rosaneae CENA516]|uniref:hypothetical protein n=1 Tax=Pantanalinema rosaneae TaxID=1620701 RepID=UPI003D6E3093